IFVVGMPRSGTTLMEQMLASHPQVHGGGELKLLEMAMNSVRLNNGGLATFPECVVDLRGTEFHDVAACYLQEVGKLAPPSAKRIVDKMTMNFRMLARSIWRCRMRRSSTWCVIRSTPACPASPSCSSRTSPTPTISASSAATMRLTGG